MDKNVTDYLLQLLTKYEPYLLSSDDENKLRHGKVQFIADKLFRKKFRRRELVDKTRQAIQKKVELSLTDNRPLHFVVPFGGYKHFWNPSHPEPDWAELFNFKYLTEYVSPVLAVYEPGVVIEYMSEDLILNRMNNYPQSSLDKYSEIFRQIQSWYSQYIPKNLKFDFFRVRERCDENIIIQAVEKLLPERRIAFDKLSPDEKAQELRRSYRSVFWNGDKDLTTLNEKERENRVIESRLVELAYYDTEAQPEFMGDYLGEDNHICICFSFGTTHDNDSFQDLTLGSTYGSVVDHWIGTGILVNDNEKFSPRIISRNQFQNNQKLFSLQKIQPPFLPYKNYQTIQTIKKVDFGSVLL